MTDSAHFDVFVHLAFLHIFLEFVGRAIQFNIYYEWLPKFVLMLRFLSIKEDAYEKAYQIVHKRKKDV